MVNTGQFWDEFSFEYRLNEGALFTNLVSIEGYKLAADNLVLPPEWSNQLDRLNRVRALHGTTAMEGNTLSEQDIADQFESLSADPESIVNAGLTREQLQVRNANLAQDWVKARFYPGSEPVHIGDILTMHRMITQGSDERNNTPGRLRSFSVQVGSPDMGGVHIGAHYQRLDILMPQFVEFINSPRVANCHPVVGALLAHFFLVTIHPFGDGNGRVSRLLEAGILFRGGYNVLGFYGLSNYFYRNEARYKTLLQQCRHNQPFDVSPFVEFGVAGFVAELAGINNFIKTKLNRAVYRQMIVHNHNSRLGPRRRVLNEREYQFLDFLLTETEPSDPFSMTPPSLSLTELSNHPYIRAVYGRRSPRTFSRELTRLDESGFIKLHRPDQSSGQTIELDFDAIGKYPLS